MKIFYSQKSYTDTLGTCTNTIAQAGCFITSACNLFPRLIDFNKNPSELNKYCTKNGLYTNGCLLNASKLASKLGLTYEKTTKNPKIACIAETSHYKSKGVPQHFYLLKPDGTIIDPLDKVPDWKKNPYNIVSYRVFKKIETEEKTVSEVAQTNAQKQGFEIQEDGTITTTTEAKNEPVPIKNTEVEQDTTEVTKTSQNASSELTEETTTTPTIVTPTSNHWQSFFESLISFLISKLKK